jgi:hypothetical protein
MESDKTKPSVKICFAVLMHKKREVVQDMLDNIRFYCPNSSIVLFNGGMDPNLCKNLGYPVCPTSRKLTYGVTAIYILEVMEWLNKIGYKYDYLINLDSDALFLREGYEKFIEKAMKDTDYMGVDVFIREKDWFCGVQLKKEWRKWKSLLLTKKFLGAFNVGQVFSRRYVKKMLTSRHFKQLKRNLLHTKAFGIDEIVYVMMAKRLGFKPKSYPVETGSSIRYRPHYTYQEIMRLMNESPRSFLIHPVHRKMKDEARTLIRSLMRKAWRKQGFSPNDSKNIYKIRSMDGIPGLLRNHDTLELVSPLAQGGFGHWTQSVDKKGSSWSGPHTFGSGKWDDVSIIRSSYDNLEFIAKQGDRLFHVWHDKDTRKWNITQEFASGVLGTPVFMQNLNGNFEVIAPLESGGIGHWWRNNSNPKQPWHGPTIIGDGKAAAVSLLNSRDGQLVAVLKKNGRLLSYIPDGKSSWILSGPHE